MHYKLTKFTNFSIFEFQVVKTLAGQARGTATWSTNVGNEHGQVLMSVLTASEGGFLQPMIDGLVRRYETAGKFKYQNNFIRLVFIFRILTSSFLFRGI
jgi:hypothetical protein